MPTATAVMLVDGRPEMVKRAICCFKAQTFPNAKLLVYDSGKDALWPFGSLDPQICYFHRPRRPNDTIGELRNWANHLVEDDIICHFDSDDWSAPERMAEQFLLLDASGADAVGFSDMLVWNGHEAWRYAHPMPSKYTIGASLCYWRHVWQKRKFRNTSKGEDFQFCAGIKTVARSSFHPGPPRFIAGIHGGNTCLRVPAKSTEWKRAPGWDDYCRDLMECSEVVRVMANYRTHTWQALRQRVEYGTGFEYVAVCMHCGCENRGDPAEFPELEYPPCERLDP